MRKPHKTGKIVGSEVFVSVEDVVRRSIMCDDDQDMGVWRAVLPKIVYVHYTFDCIKMVTYRVLDEGVETMLRLKARELIPNSIIPSIKYSALRSLC